MGNELEGIGEIQAGAIPENINSPWDAPTIAIDGISAVTINSHLAKISFVEHIAYDETLKARNMVNLVVPIDQFFKIVEGLSQIAAKFADAKIGAE